MSEEMTTKINRLTPYHKRPASNNLVKGSDLSVHVPTTDEAKGINSKGSFKNVLSGYVDQVNTAQHTADAEVQRLVSGETEDLHEVMLAMDEAETSFQMMMEIRNKLVDAYKDLSRMN